MKNLLAFFISSLFASIAVGQTTAQDFTKSDCNSVSHHLFTELDSGYCVLIEFAMLPSCGSCISAGKKLEVMKSGINAAYPAKVKWYVMDFSGAHSCGDIATWKATHKITSTSFQHGETEVDYYGGMGMPTVVLLGGSDHKVLWKKVGFATSDTTAIKAKIKEFFQSSGTGEAIQSVGFSILPNPATDRILLQLEDARADVQQVEVFDATGNKVLSHDWKTGTENSVEVSGLAKGVYFIQLLNAAKGQVGAKRFLKN